MEPDTTFTRRVCAVLLADVTGFSILMGEHDERTAHAVHHLQSIAQGIVSDHNGRAEPVAGDADTRGCSEGKAPGACARGPSVICP